MAPAKYNVYKASLSSWNRNEDSSPPVDDTIVTFVICGFILLSLLLCFCYTEDKLKNWKLMRKRKLTEEVAIIDANQNLQGSVEIPAA
ncbi:unnamed protein product [Bursaphelenchus xylophilus]|uniref:(pine wood nematode) hypothetical protein n=1 Tax=Bursaphelenchus xylophilus TaxID=6326 RepID=A0A1I7RML3_BURXY|nr:unnamed protein product [Bursaphelenchus xylophilus]CAG9125711.1 unnamed protein product [Bursaphelenchus xylophilus]